MRHIAFTAIVLVLLTCQQLCAQRIRIPQAAPQTSGAPATLGPNGFTNPQSGVPPFGAPQLGNPQLGNPQLGNPQPGAVLGNPNLAAPGFDPFAPVPGRAPLQPGIQPVQPGIQPYGAPSPYRGAPPSGFGNAPYQPQGIFGGNPYNQPYFPSSQDFLNNFEQGKYYRVIQEFHYRHTWLEGSLANEVDIHDAEIGFTLNWPNFLGSGEPLQLSPTFIFHFWDGPQAPSGGDLPSRAYSTFLSGSWTTPTNQNFGGEVVSSLGVYTDFNTFTSRSLRIKGTGMGWVRFTPNMMLKFGVSYVNRLDVKIFPVGGLYWKPSDQIEMELYFPNPKIRYKLPQVGNTEFHAYLAGNYGGDSWTIRRFAGFSDQVDLIDLRVTGGIEFVGFRGLRGFFEAGYAFDRELLYRLDPSDSIKLSDSVIVRAGFLF